MPVTVPAELRRPCAVDHRGGTTRAADIAALLLAQDAALGCANGRIEAIDQILSEAEARGPV